MINHINKKNRPQIVDVSEKKITKRKAIAEGYVCFEPKIFDKIQQMNTKKGSLENVAILAGIIGAKETSRIIPLCHNIKLNYINIDIKKINKTNSLKIISEIKTNEKTGVEMEALVAVSICCLTIYDMCKSLSKKIEIKNIKLVSKEGGKSSFSRKNKEL